MAAKDTFTFTYKSDLDFGTANNNGEYNFSYSIRAGYSDCIPNNLYSSPNGRCICSTSNLFSPRALIAKFAANPSQSGQDRNCAVIKFVVPDKGDVEDFVQQLKSCGAVCVDYVGESWGSIPPKLANYTPTFTPVFDISTGVRARKVSGVNVNYTSDLFGANQPVRVTYEAEPFALTGASIANGIVQAGGNFNNCHGNLNNSLTCGSGEVISPRKLIVGFQYVAGGGSQISKVGQRGVAIAVPNVRACITSLGGTAGVNCLGYQGESVKRIDLLV